MKTTAFDRWFDFGLRAALPSYGGWCLYVRGVRPRLDLYARDQQANGEWQVPAHWGRLVRLPSS